METISTLFSSFVDEANNFLWTYILIALLLLVGLYFTIRTKFVQFSQFKEMVRLLGEGAKTDGSDKKGITSFQAFAISTAARVGTGNLAGVASAIALGGPGAVFWMWVVALVGSASAFIESTLAQVYKVKDKDGFRGGPAYYMEKGLNKRWMGVLFSILITISFGLVFNSVQANTISLAFEEAFGVNRLIVGVVVTAIVGVLIFGGIKRVAKASELIVVVMAVVYIGLALVVLAINITEIPHMIALIIKSAFGFEEAFAGAIGAAIMNGIKRGLFSNEAGMGSAPNAAAAASVSHPAKQGFIQALAVFNDTLIICSCTAFIVLLSGAYATPGLEGIQLTQVALSTHIGGWAVQFIAIILFMFAFSSLVANYYYGETNIEFLTSNKIWLNLYRFGVILMVLFGSVASLGVVWGLADLFMALMAITNLIAIVLLGKVAIAVLNDYLSQRKAGKDPVFYKDSVKGLENLDFWERSREIDK
ncbi:alanine:cation symporter family protein [Priestia flexa]|jgi:amino acid carrier protein|uniref:Alanine/glycine:cation symporter family protein n=2 Tax=Bacilli TaxID=91061 RepID=A0A1N6PV82_9BACI|nr:alanine/glycine:cation symporter family protein [Priestia flexa]MBN8253142.1 alanine:cation symporter family protein [Priestia flexa]MBN8433781.1 alanine:cation symporter family protein [Priestia flexa]MBY6086846.1 alanine:cation symporter family protein [Priestia flexa]MCA0965961.1 alanine:cation symporter family protein [Priestia flexa]MCA1203655.1 alanine:cation symporter family protein [Priestia flexa]